MKDTNSYLDFAENDFYSLCMLYSSYMDDTNQNHNIEPPNFFCSGCQNACEKYLKFIISEKINNLDSQKLIMLKTHNINKLSQYLKEKGIDLDYQSFIRVNGYYFETRYPGEDSYFVSDEDIQICWKALLSCRTNVLSYMGIE